MILNDFNGTAVQEHDVAKLIKRHLIIAEDVEQHVALATKHTIPHTIVRLPMRATTLSVKSSPSAIFPKTKGMSILLIFTIRVQI